MIRSRCMQLSVPHCLSIAYYELDGALKSLRSPAFALNRCFAFLGVGSQEHIPASSGFQMMPFGVSVLGSMRLGLLPSEE